MTLVVDSSGAEEAAWAEVQGAWHDEERHRAYLARFEDLDGLAVAGRRYREALAARPDDEIALRFRDEVVKRAMVQGLASLPRAKAEPRRSRLLVRAAAFVVVAGLAAAAWLIARKLWVFVGAHP